MQGTKLEVYKLKISALLNHIALMVNLGFRLYCTILCSLHAGHCITSVSMDDICNLNSFAVGCELLSASACRCYESSESNNDNSCQGKRLYHFINHS